MSVKKNKTINNDLLEIYDLNTTTEPILKELTQVMELMETNQNDINEKGLLYKNPTGKIESSPLLDIAKKLNALYRDHVNFLASYKKEEEYEEEEDDDDDEELDINDFI